MVRGIDSLINCSGCVVLGLITGIVAASRLRAIAAS
jgi:hypothetical protein